LFPTEVLRPGDKFSVGAMALLFTDLKGSTSMYERCGDAIAFGTVRAHFTVLIDEVEKHHGCVVKTIGDAVMAAFIQPAQAVSAAISIQQHIATRNAQNREKEQIHLKIGVHFGACLAVNLNDRLDYFGSAVNVAARLEGVCEAGNVVISGDLFEQPGVAQVIEIAKRPFEKQTKNLRGVSKEVTVIVIRCE
jgi:adenylate cyclase